MVSGLTDLLPSVTEQLIGAVAGWPAGPCCLLKVSTIQVWSKADYQSVENRNVTGLFGNQGLNHRRQNQTGNRSFIARYNFGTTEREKWWLADP